MIRRLIAALALFVATIAPAQTAQPPAPAPVLARVLLHTSAGDILVALETQ
jgi:hypothetical protein